MFRLIKFAAAVAYGLLLSLGIPWFLDVSPATMRRMAIVDVIIAVGLLLAIAVVEAMRWCWSEGSLARDLADATADDPARGAAADAAGVAPDDMVWCGDRWKLRRCARVAQPPSAVTQGWACSRCGHINLAADGTECSFCHSRRSDELPDRDLPAAESRRDATEPAADLAADAARPLRVYVASSWWNGQQPFVVHALQVLGCEVYDFRNPPQSSAFAWSALGADWRERGVARFRVALRHPFAIAGFDADMRGLAEADVCVLVLPCGRSAHLEAGWAVGKGMPLIVYSPEPCEPELMYRMSTDICASEAELVAALARIDAERTGYGLPTASGLQPPAADAPLAAGSAAAQGICRRGGA